MITTDRFFPLLAVVVAIALSGAATETPQAQGRRDLPPQAIARIEAALREKQSRTPTERKIDSRLLREVKRRGGEPLDAPTARGATDIRYAADGHLVVDVKARVTDALLDLLKARGVEVLASDRGRSTLRAHIDIDRVRELADMPGVTFVQPQQQAITWRQGPTTVQVPLHGSGVARGEGDVTHLAHVTRNAFGVNGTGIKIGVLSDGVNHLTASQASGDLGPVTVVPGQAGSGNEGTAMLEIVHELAPGAQLFFATATGGAGVTSFADNIRTLRFTYDCDIIIDDVFYLLESPFHDGQPGPSQTEMAAVTQAVNDVTADGALHFSAAGNSGNLSAATSSTWEGDFNDGGSAAVLGLPGRLHEFAPGQAYNVVTGAGPATTLHWADPIGASANDYDIFAFDETLTILFDLSTNLQTGAEDPFESMTSVPGDHVVIVKADGAQDRFLHLSGVGATLQIATSGAIQGHAGAANAIAVGATAANQVFPFAFNNTRPIERFSSDGNRRVFYRANGTPYTPGNFSSAGGTVRQKPDLTAADAVRVTGVGGFPSTFFGTSAAAPHAGAIAALVLSKNPAQTPAQVRTALATTAIDIASPGADRDSGAGIVMADAALRSISPGPALAPLNVYAFDGPGNATLLNNHPEAGEGGYVSVDLGNWGATTAAGISAVITSSTPGITVRQQAPSSYANLPTSATGFANVPFFFTVASGFACPASASFTMTVNSNAGSQVFNFNVPIGPPRYEVFETLDATPPASAPGLSTLTGIQTQRLLRTGSPSACGTAPPPPSLFVETGSENPNRRFDAYTFNTCTTSVPTCVTVSLNSTNALFSAAYAPTFNQFDITQNYKGDVGASGGLRSYSFNIPGGGQGFAVDVHQVDGNVGLGDVYALTVEGACGGTCAPPNQVPVAKAKNVTLTADETGFAFVHFSQINDGSFDPDGDALVFSVEPVQEFARYPVGQTTVFLTVSDTRGATSQASAVITVTPQPVVSIGDVSVSEGDFGTVNATFAVSLSNPSTLEVSVFASTLQGTASVPSDFLHNSGVIVFQPGQLSKTFTVTVQGDITAEADETFTVNLSSPFNVAIGDGQGVGTILNDDVFVTEASVTQAVLTGATRLKELQRADGGWYFRVGDTDCRAGAGVSCINTVGITALGLLAGHTRTGDASLLTAAAAAGDYLVARYNATTGAVPPVLPASQDVEFLVELGAKTGNALYTTTAANWFQRIVANYTAEAYVDRLIAVRGAFAPLGVWNVGSFIRSAKAVNNVAYATAAALHVTSPPVEALWKDTDPAHRFDACGNPNGCGAPSNPFGYDYTLVAMGTMLNAIHDIANANPALLPKIDEYQNHLVNSQDPAGSWDVGDTQITAYVVLGLASLPTTPSTVIETAVSWFLNYQQAPGGWPAYAVGLLQGAEYTELDAEAVRAIFTLYNTPEGEGVSVAPAQFSTLTFSEVTESGRTSVVATEVPEDTTTTPGVEVLDNLAYDVSTTAVVNGLTTVCFTVPSVTSATDFADVRVLHQEGTVLVDRTILGSGLYAPNYEQRRVCGEVTSLSPFAIGTLDRTAPTASVTLSPSELIADEKNVVSITASISVSDNTDPSPTVTLVSITSSEPDKGLGKGDSPNDIHNAKVGTDDRDFGLRAEAFNAAGRVYTAVYRVADRYGNSREVAATVTVRPNSRK